MHDPKSVPGNLKGSLKRAEAVYQLGRDQINISLCECRIPNTANWSHTPAIAQLGARDSFMLQVGSRVKTPVELDDDDFPLVEGVNFNVVCRS
jgi:hypothetical protein